MNNTWISLDVKTKFALVSAVAAFFLGWGLTIAAFFTPPIGEVHDSILWILGQSLIYVSSIFGVGAYFSSETRQLKRDIGTYLKENVK